MIQRSEHLRFALEARHARGIARKCFRQDLQRHLTIQLRVAGTIHFTHPARAKGREDFVRS